jgi:hypothetical protein
MKSRFRVALVSLRVSVTVAVNGGAGFYGITSAGVVALATVWSDSLIVNRRCVSTLLHSKYWHTFRLFGQMFAANLTLGCGAFA